MKIYLFISVLFHIFILCCLFLPSKAQKRKNDVLEINLIFTDELKMNNTCKKSKSQRCYTDKLVSKKKTLAKSNKLWKIGSQKNSKNHRNVGTNNDQSCLGTAKFGVRDMIPYKSNKNPIYPLIALRNNIKGRVIVRICVNEKGKVIDTKILQSPSSILSEATINAVKIWKFYRTLKTNVRVIVPIDFRSE